LPQISQTLGPNLSLFLPLQEIVIDQNIIVYLRNAMKLQTQNQLDILGNQKYNSFFTAIA
jgi:hypothetical protein